MKRVSTDQGFRQPPKNGSVYRDMGKSSSQDRAGGRRPSARSHVMNGGVSKFRQRKFRQIDHSEMRSEGLPSADRTPSIIAAVPTFHGESE